MDAALFNGCSLRVFIFVDHVLVGGLFHDLQHFGLDPGGTESGEILPRVAVEYELIVDGLIDGSRLLLCFRKPVRIGLVIQDLGLKSAGGGSFGVLRCYVGA